MFEGCTLLSSVSFQGSRMRIESYALKDCASLLSLDVPSSVLSISEDVFWDGEDIASKPALSCMLMRGRSEADVSSMDGYSWNLPASCIWIEDYGTKATY